MKCNLVLRADPERGRALRRAWNQQLRACVRRNNCEVLEEAPKKLVLKPRKLK